MFDLFVHDPLSSAGYPIIIGYNITYMYTHSDSKNLPTKTLVANWQYLEMTNTQYTHVHAHVHTYETKWYY